MSEWKLFHEPLPDWAYPEWYEGRAAAHHLETADHCARLVATASVIHAIAEQRREDGYGTTVSDVGCGDGSLLSLLDTSLITDKWGYEISPMAVEHATKERGLDVEQLDVVRHTQSIITGDVIVCTEMLEHLVDPHGFLAALHQQSYEGEILVASSPMNENWEIHYVHHMWSWDINGYTAMLETCWQPYGLVTVGGAYQIHSARSR